MTITTCASENEARKSIKKRSIIIRNSGFLINICEFLLITNHEYMKLLHIDYIFIIQFRIYSEV